MQQENVPGRCRASLYYLGRRQLVASCGFARCCPGNMPRSVFGGDEASVGAGRGDKELSVSRDTGEGGRVWGGARGGGEGCWNAGMHCNSDFFCALLAAAVMGSFCGRLGCRNGDGDWRDRSRWLSACSSVAYERSLRTACYYRYRSRALFSLSPWPYCA